MKKIVNISYGSDDDDSYGADDDKDSYGADGGSDKKIFMVMMAMMAVVKKRQLWWLW